MEYKIGDRVEAYCFDCERYDPATVEGYGHGELGHLVFFRFLDGTFGRYQSDSKLIRPLPTPPPPFKVGDEVEVKDLGQWMRAKVTDVVQFDDHWKVSFTPKTRDGVWCYQAPSTFFIRPYTPPKLVPLSAEELLGKWVKDEFGNMGHVNGKARYGKLQAMPVGYFKPEDAVGFGYQWSDSPAGPWKPCSKEEVRDGK
jgi:hypothetical protein